MRFSTKTIIAETVSSNLYIKIRPVSKKFNEYETTVQGCEEYGYEIDGDGAVTYGTKELAIENAKLCLQNLIESDLDEIEESVTVKEEKGKETTPSQDHIAAIKIDFFNIILNKERKDTLSLVRNRALRHGAKPAGGDVYKKHRCQRLLVYKTIQYKLVAGVTLDKWEESLLTHLLNVLRIY